MSSFSTSTLNFLTKSPALAVLEQKNYCTGTGKLTAKFPHKGLPYLCGEDHAPFYALTQELKKYIDTALENTFFALRDIHYIGGSLLKDFSPSYYERCDNAIGLQSLPSHIFQLAHQPKNDIDIRVWMRPTTPMTPEQYRGALNNFRDKAVQAFGENCQESFIISFDNNLFIMFKLAGQNHPIDLAFVISLERTSLFQMDDLYLSLTPYLKSPMPMQLRPKGHQNSGWQAYLDRREKLLRINKVQTVQKGWITYIAHLASGYTPVQDYSAALISNTNALSHKIKTVRSFTCLLGKEITDRIRLHGYTNEEKLHLTLNTILMNRDHISPLEVPIFLRDALSSCLDKNEFPTLLEMAIDLLKQKALSPNEFYGIITLTAMLQLCFEPLHSTHHITTALIGYMSHTPYFKMDMAINDSFRSFCLPFAPMDAFQHISSSTIENAAPLLPLLVDTNVAHYSGNDFPHIAQLFLHDPTPILFLANTLLQSPSDELKKIGVMLSKILMLFPRNPAIDHFFFNCIEQQLPIGIRFDATFLQEFRVYQLLRYLQTSPQPKEILAVLKKEYWDLDPSFLFDRIENLEDQSFDKLQLLGKIAKKSPLLTERYQAVFVSITQALLRQNDYENLTKALHTETLYPSIYSRETVWQMEKEYLEVNPTGLVSDKFNRWLLTGLELGNREPILLSAIKAYLEATHKLPEKSIRIFMGTLQSLMIYLAGCKAYIEILGLWELLQRHGLAHQLPFTSWLEAINAVASQRSKKARTTLSELVPLMVVDLHKRKAHQSLLQLWELLLKHQLSSLSPQDLLYGTFKTVLKSKTLPPNQIDLLFLLSHEAMTVIKPTELASEFLRLKNQEYTGVWIQRAIEHENSISPKFIETLIPLIKKCRWNSQQKAECMVQLLEKALTNKNLTSSTPLIPYLPMVFSGANSEHARAITLLLLQKATPKQGTTATQKKLLEWLGTVPAPQKLEIIQLIDKHHPKIDPFDTDPEGVTTAIKIWTATAPEEVQKYLNAQPKGPSSLYTHLLTTEPLLFKTIITAAPTEQKKQMILDFMTKHPQLAEWSWVHEMLDTKHYDVAALLLSFLPVENTIQERRRLIPALGFSKAIHEISKIVHNLKTPTLEELTALKTAMEAYGTKPISAADVSTLIPIFTALVPPYTYLWRQLFDNLSIEHSIEEIENLWKLFEQQFITDVNYPHKESYYLPILEQYALRKAAAPESILTELVTHRQQLYTDRELRILSSSLPYAPQDQHITDLMKVYLENILPGLLSTQFIKIIEVFLSWKNPELDHSLLSHIKGYLINSDNRALKEQILDTLNKATHPLPFDLMKEIFNLGSIPRGIALERGKIVCQQLQSLRTNVWIKRISHINAIEESFESMLKFKQTENPEFCKPIFEELLFLIQNSDMIHTPTFFQRILENKLLEKTFHYETLSQSIRKLLNILQNEKPPIALSSIDIFITLLTVYFDHKNTRNSKDLLPFIKNVSTFDTRYSAKNERIRVLCSVQLRNMIIRKKLITTTPEFLDTLLIARDFEKLTLYFTNYPDEFVNISRRHLNSIPHSKPLFWESVMNYLQNTQLKPLPAIVEEIYIERLNNLLETTECAVTITAEFISISSALSTHYYIMPALVKSFYESMAITCAIFIQKDLSLSTNESYVNAVLVLTKTISAMKKLVNKRDLLVCGLIHFEQISKLLQLIKPFFKTYYATRSGSMAGLLDALQEIVLHEYKTHMNIEQLEMRSQNISDYQNILSLGCPSEAGTSNQ